MTKQLRVQGLAVGSGADQVAMTRFIDDHGIRPVIDSRFPLAQLADHLVIVPTGSPAFLNTLAPAFVVAEILGALVAGHAGRGAVEALRRFDEQGAALGTHLFHRSPGQRQKESQ